MGLLGYFIIEGGIATFDSTSRVIYTLLQKQGGDVSDPMDLVGVSVDTGKIVSNPTFCVSGRDCPWSIEFGP